MERKLYEKHYLISHHPHDFRKVSMLRVMARQRVVSHWPTLFVDPMEVEATLLQLGQARFFGNGKVLGTPRKVGREKG
jgi:hypothetical protein